MPGLAEQFELVFEWASELAGQLAGQPRRRKVPVPPSPPPARNGSPGEQLISRLKGLGLPSFREIATHRNEQVMLSWVPGKVLRIHEGYAGASDEVLLAIVRFVTPGIRRATRLAARRVFLGFPVEDHAPRPPRPTRRFRVAPQDRPAHERLTQLFAELNAMHFQGTLPEIPIRISGRMRTRLGELRLDRRTGRAVHIGISRRHIRRDGWTSVTDTLLHEMVHQWQAESGGPVDHGRRFREKARAVGIEPRAVRRDW
ncbi:MAG TPA: SprT-like domain-containing protein [Gemmatimonadales bacterium]|nr:SprT-like domain-containing protein [Gemmatimonadales bacterium]